VSVKAVMIKSGYFSMQVPYSLCFLTVSLPLYYSVMSTHSDMCGRMGREHIIDKHKKRTAISLSIFRTLNFWKMNPPQTKRAWQFIKLSHILSHTVEGFHNNNDCGKYIYEKNERPSNIHFQCPLFVEWRFAIFLMKPHWSNKTSNPFPFAQS